MNIITTLWMVILTISNTSRLLLNLLLEYHVFKHLPCAILLCGCDNTVVNRHGPLDRLADWDHDLLLVLLLHHLLIFITHRYLAKCQKIKGKKSPVQECVLMGLGVF